jgi:hypothetical protein
MSVSSETQVKERQILLVGPYGVLGTGVIDAVAENPKCLRSSEFRTCGHFRSVGKKLVSKLCR